MADSFVATATVAAEPVNISIFFMFITGFIFFLWGIWCLLAYQNKKILLFRSGKLIYSAPYGRYKEFHTKTFASMKYGAMGSVRIHDSAGNLLFLSVPLCPAEHSLQTGCQNTVKQLLLPDRTKIQNSPGQSELPESL